MNDGLLGNQFRARSRYRTGQGYLLFGCNDGVNYFHPDSLPINHQVAPVVFTRFTLQRKQTNQETYQPASPVHINALDTLILRPYQNNFSIEFALLNYTNPQENEYAYRLSPFDEQWNPIGTRRKATYTNLPPGDYQFQVVGANNDKVWNKKGKTIFIRILTPWWKRTWVLVFSLLMILALVFVFIRLRIARISKQKSRLEALVNERTHELQARQEEILAQNEEILSQKESLEKKNTAITKSNKQLEDLIIRFQLISEYGQRISMLLEPQSIIQMTYDYVDSILDAYLFTVGIFNPYSQALRFPVTYIEKEKQVPFSLSIEKQDSLAIRTYHRGKELLIQNYPEEQAQYLPARLELSVKQPIVSAFYIPLKSEGQVVGVLTVQSPKAQCYQANDLNAVRALASYIGIAIANANAYQKLDSQNRDIQASLRYGKSIQQAILPLREDMEAHLQYFALFRPRDVVSGDFYWFAHLPANHEHPEMSLVAAVDCTGHGVPGAFMSMIGVTTLNDIVRVKKVYQPDQILHLLNERIQHALKQDITENRDGMDVALCSITPADDDQVHLCFSGAKRPLFWYQHENKTVEIISGNRRTIGGLQVRKEPFVNHNIVLHKHDTVYLTSDGIMDQNNHSRKRLGYRQFVQWLQAIGEKDMPHQHQWLAQQLDTFMDNELQRDDITVLGIRPK